MKASNAKRVAAVIQEASKHYTAETLSEGEAGSMGEGWQEIVRGLGTIQSFSFIERGFAEDTLAIVEGANGYEVGTGESLRPYVRHYRGTNEDVAVTTFVNQANANFPDPEDEEGEIPKLNASQMLERMRKAQRERATPRRWRPNPSEIVVGKYRQRSIIDSHGVDVGRLRYRLERGVLYIDMIAVTSGEQRKGLATKALEQLVIDTKATKISATEDGWSEEGQAFIEEFIYNRPSMYLYKERCEKHSLGKAYS